MRPDPRTCSHDWDGILQSFTCKICGVQGWETRGIFPREIVPIESSIAMLLIERLDARLDELEKKP